MNELKIIDQREVLGKDFRIYGTVENPLFLAKDVAEWIEHSDVSMMLNKIDEGEKLIQTMLVSGQNRQVWFLTEDGVYEVLMQSRKPVAKAFKKQVKEILKSIRKNDGYIAGQESLSDEELMARALMVAQNTLKQREAKINELEVTNSALTVDNQIMKPKADYFPASAEDEGALQVKASGATDGQIDQAKVKPYFGEGTPAAESYVVPGTLYVTYVLGEGAISFEDIGAKVPYEMARDPKTNGGEDTLYTRQRKVFAPFGISYEKTSQTSLSPTDEELENGANWCLVHSGESDEGQRSYIAHKAIPIARILSRG